uniref:Secreted protein n=1 Tax=Steinernema glaseri TaxID=37863 RepID=A0A1I7YZC0_9BILA
MCFICVDYRDCDYWQSYCYMSIAVLLGGWMTPLFSTGNKTKKCRNSNPLTPSMIMKSEAKRAPTGLTYP